MTSWRFRSTLRVADAAFTGEKEVPLDAACLGMTCAASERSHGGGNPPMTDV